MQDCSDPIPALAIALLRVLQLVGARAKHRYGLVRSIADELCQLRVETE